MIRYVRTSLVLTAVALVAVACAPGQPPPQTDLAELPTNAPASATAEPTPGSSPTPFPEIEPGLRRLTSLDDFQTQFNLDQGFSRVVLMLSSGCPSCMAGAEWIQEGLLKADPDLNLRLYAVWFPTVARNQLPSETNPLWDPDVLDDPRVISYWDSQLLVSEFFAANVELQGFERSTVPQTFGGIQWGSAVWDTYYLYGPEGEWQDVPSGLIQSGYPILDARNDLADAMGIASEPAGDLVTGGIFEIDPRRSLVTYRVQETLLGSRLNTAVGFTNHIQGTIEVDLDDLDQLVLSPIVVDISSLRSDNFLRDERIQVEFLESATFPTAIFMAQDFVGVPDTAAEGESVELEIRGVLEVREIEVPTTFQVTARVQGGELTGHAEGMVLMTDFGFDPPAIGNLIAAENEVRLELDFVAVPVSP